MSRVKDQYHDEICAAAEDTTYNHAQAEYEAELKRLRRIKRVVEFGFAIDAAGMDSQKVVDLSSEFVKEVL